MNHAETHRDDLGALGAAIGPERAGWLHDLLGAVDPVEDLSWPGVPSRVWRVRDRTGTDRVVKFATGPMRHHTVREIDAHDTVVAALARTGSASRRIGASRELGILVTSFLPGRLVETTDSATDPAVHRITGGLLARIHTQGRRVDPTYDADQTARTRDWLAGDHRIPATVVARVREILDAHDPTPVVVVPTHGDWQPRNWVIDPATNRVGVIDFGRFAWRPAHSDLVRCWFGVWHDHPGLLDAHLAGYGADPRDATWPMECLRQAVSTAAWAHQMGDEAFEARGLVMIDRALASFETG